METGNKKNYVFLTKGVLIFFPVMLSNLKIAPPLVMLVAFRPVMGSVAVYFGGSFEFKKLFFFCIVIRKLNCFYVEDNTSLEALNKVCPEL